MDNLKKVEKLMERADVSYEEAKELMEELMKADNPYNCPHGRPTLIVMSKYDIEKKFKRIV